MFKKTTQIYIFLISSIASIDTFAVDGSVTDTALTTVICENVTTGQKVIGKKIKKNHLWNCGTNFLTRDGETIQITLRGTSFGGNSIELAYDDGSSETGDSPWGNTSHSQIAQKFTSSFYPVHLVKVKFWVLKYGTPNTTFRIRVYAADGANGAPGSSLLGSIVTATADAGDEWVSVDLSQENITVRGDFFISMEWLTPPGDNGMNAQVLGMDTNNPVRRTWRSYDGYNWKRIETVGSSGDRNAMIRAAVN